VVWMGRSRISLAFLRSNPILVLSSL